MSRVHKRGAAKAESNLTPLIDITFQVVLFFMLTQRIVSDEMVEMRVPDVTNPSTREVGEISRVVVNIAPTPRVQTGDGMVNPLDHGGAAAYVRVGLQDYSMQNLDGVRAALERARERFVPTAEDDELEVLLRVDAAIFYSEVVPVMNQITQAGIEKVHLVALLPEDRR